MSGLVQLAPDSLFAGDFRVVRPLAEGAMGAVYVVEQLSTKKLRALKLMQPSLVASADLRRRFEREAQIASNIKSAHVVETIGAGVDGKTGIPWLAMELLEGDTLAARVERTGPLDVASVREAFGQLGHALGKAHEASIVHRDLKPENIFLALSQHRGVPFTLKVLDFGIARVTHEVRTTSSNTRGSIGTPLWWAPEQASPDAKVGAYTDVWSLGLIAFWLLTGRYFWKSAYVEGASIQMMAMEQFVAPMATASARATAMGVGERLPPGFDAWFAATVQRDADARMRNATVASDAFEALFTQRSASQRPSSPVSSEMAHGATVMATGPGSDAAVANTAMASGRGSNPPMGSGRASDAGVLRASAPGALAMMATEPPRAVRNPSHPSYPPPGRPDAQSAPAFGAATGIPLQTATSGAVTAPRKPPIALLAGAFAAVSLLGGFGVWRAFSGSSTAADPGTASARPASGAVSGATAAPSNDSPASTVAVVIAPAAGEAAEAPSAEPAPAVAAGAATHAPAHPSEVAMGAVASPTHAAPAAAPAPTPTQAAPAGPPLTNAEIDKGTASARSGMKHGCWSAAKSSAPKGTPKTAHVSVAITVDSAGNVTATRGWGGDAFPGLASCAAMHARTLHFRPTTPGTFTVGFDFK